MGRRYDSIYTMVLAYLLMVVLIVALDSADLVANFNLLFILLPIATIGFLAGAALAQSRFPAFTAHIYSFVYGVFTTAYFVGRTFDPNLTWRDRAIELIDRLVVWSQQLLEGGTSRDALVFVMHTSFILWFLGYFAAWNSLRTRRFWRVILSCGGVLLSVVYYGRAQLVLYLATFTILALLYLAEGQLISRKEEWRSRGIPFRPNISLHFWRASLILSLSILFLAYRLPVLTASPSISNSFTKINQPWQTVRDEWQRMFSALNAQPRAANDSYGRTLSLGGPRQINDIPVMDIYVPEQLPYAYWRATTLDRYEQGTWHMAEGQNSDHLPDEGRLSLPAWKQRRLLDVTVINYIPNSGTLYTLPDFASSDHQVVVTTVTDPNGRLVPIAVRPRFLLQLGDEYQVSSQYSVADEESLRASSTNYPLAIRQNYLTVPPEITLRTRQLARQLTDPYPNPYDKAVAVQNYLRNTIRYNDQIPAPPAGAEPIDHILFVTQEGYCNYYASAMAVMLREVGVPARLSRGYASGDFNKEDNVYRVRARDAHTWPELYFEGFGWLPFEPTSGQDEVEREVGDREDSADLNPIATPTLFPEQQQPDPEIELLTRQPPQSPNQSPEGGTGVWRKAFWAILLLGGAAIPVFVLRQNIQRQERDVFRSYARLEQWARQLGLPTAPQQTPYERAQLLIKAMPSAYKPIQRLIEEYVRRQFSRDKTPDLFFNGAKEWRALRPILWQKWRERWLRRKK